jgi:glycosyltransferase involved in cell wall biosynthesis
MTPEISVVTVCFNASSTIADTLSSVANQSDVEFEHIVVDGGSSDSTLDLIRRHAHNRLFAVSEPDDGIYDAMNKGLARANGRYVMFLNADDYLARPDALAIAAAKLVETNADCLLADTQFVGRDGRTPQYRRYSTRPFGRWWLRFGAQPPHPSMLMRRKLIHELGGFDTQFRIAGDFDLIARAFLLHRAAYAKLPVVMTHFRLGGISTGGLKSKVVLSRELAFSLKRMGYRLSALRVMFRLPFKLLQLQLPFPRRRYSSEWFSAGKDSSSERC